MPRGSSLTNDHAHDVYVLTCKIALRILDPSETTDKCKYKVRGWPEVYDKWNAAHHRTLNHAKQDILKNCFREEFLHSMSLKRLRKLKSKYERREIRGSNQEDNRGSQIIVIEDDDDDEGEEEIEGPSRMKSKKDSDHGQGLATVQEMSELSTKVTSTQEEIQRIQEDMQRRMDVMQEEIKQLKERT